MGLKKCTLWQIVSTKLQRLKGERRKTKNTIEIQKNLVSLKNISSQIVLNRLSILLR